MSKTSEKLTDSKETKEFLESLAILGVGTKIFRDGVEYTDRVGFWQWIKNNHPGMDLDSAKAIKEVAGNLEKTIQGKPYEWDWVNHYRDNPLNVGKVVNLSEDKTAPIDAVIKNLFTGQEVSVQLKAPTTASSISNALAEIKEKPADLHIGPKEMVDKAKEMGFPYELREFQNGENIKQSLNERIEEAKSGEAVPGLDLNGVMSQIGEGALIGAVVYAGVSALSHFRAYKRGEISGKEYAKLVGKNSVKGTIMGGGLAFINIPVQLSATAIGVGMPVTIPVMIVCAYGLRKIIEPIFKEGRYAEIVKNMSYSTDTARAWAHFAVLSCYLYESQKQFLNKVSKHFKDFADRERIVGELDTRLQRGLEGI